MRGELPRVRGGNTGTDWLAFEGEAQPRSAQNLSTSTIAAQLAAKGVLSLGAAI